MFVLISSAIFGKLRRMDKQHPPCVDCFRAKPPLFCAIPWRSISIWHFLVCYFAVYFILKMCFIFFVLSLGQINRGPLRCHLKGQMQELPRPGMKYSICKYLCIFSVLIMFLTMTFALHLKLCHKMSGFVSPSTTSFSLYGKF